MFVFKGYIWLSMGGGGGGGVSIHVDFFPFALVIDSCRYFLFG